MNCRDLTRTAPAVLLTGAIPAVASVAEETPIMALFREFKAHSEMWANMPFDIPSEEDDWQAAVQADIERCIVALPSQSATNMAIKLTIRHFLDDLSCMDFDGPVWAEARALIGGCIMKTASDLVIDAGYLKAVIDSADFIDGENASGTNRHASNIVTGPVPVLFRSSESDALIKGDRVCQRHTATSSSVMRFASRSPVA